MYYLAFAKPTNKYHIIVNWVIEAHFYTDLVLSFFCEYIDSETNIPVREFRLIVKHYLFSWFLIDFMSVFPFEELLPVGDSTGGLTKLFRLFRMPRLIKLIDVGRFKNILKSF
jgi:potassium voltage-gated channel Eag-related subfamily H protein 7